MNSPAKYILNYAGRVARFSDELDARDFALRVSARGVGIVEMTTMRGGLLGRWRDGKEL